MPPENHSSSRLSMMVIVAVWVAMLWSLVAFDLWRLYRGNDREAVLHAQSIAMVMDEYTQRTMLALDLALLGLGDNIAKMDSTTANFRSEVEHTIKSIRDADVLGSISFLDAQGFMVAASDLMVAPEQSFAGRDYFSAHQAKPDLGLYVAAPIRGSVTGRPFLPLSRRITDGNGRFIGVIVGLLDTRGIAEHFSRHTIGSHGGVGLLHAAHKRIIARHPDFEATFGQDIGASPIAQALDNQTKSGVIAVESMLDKRSRTVVFRHLDKLPLVVVVGIDREDILQEMLAGIPGYLGLAMLMTLATVLLGMRLDRSQQHLVLSQQALRKELQVRVVAEQSLQRSEQVFRSLVQHVPGAMYRCQVAAPWRVTFISEGIGDLSGISAEAFLSGEVAYGYLIHPDDLERVVQAVDQGVTQRGPYEVQYRLRHVDGAVHSVYECGRAHYDIEGNAEYLDGVIVDISRRLRDEERLREAAMVFEVSSDAILITDPDGVIKSVNPAFTEITGYTAAEAIGQTPRLLKSGRHEKDFYDRIWEALNTCGRWEGEIWNRRRSGEIYPEWQTISAVRSSDGRVSEYVSQFSDITRRKLTEEEIRHRANYDALTGLPNRSLLIERLEQSILKSQRGRSQFALLFLDLDQFKQVNDTLGHAIGDHLLEEVANRLLKCVREVDTVARMGGDEFIILLTGIESASGAEIVAEKCLETIKQRFDLSQHEVHVGASIGIALYPDDGDNVETLLRDADLAMYRAKESGRGNFQFFEESMTEAVMARRHLESDLRQAVERNEFVVHYQPIVNFQTGKLEGAEALIRWNHPQRGMVSPETFIPLAEDLGFIRGIGQWVIETSCQQLVAWQKQGVNIQHIAINVSSRQIPDGLMIDWLQALLDRHGLVGGNLVIEITEGVLLADTPKTLGWMDAMHRMGCQISVDDFGTGYSSLSYLKKFPVDIVKIDRSFVRDMQSNRADRSLVQAILAMAHSLELSVVAEGIEVAEQFELLCGLGCDFAQGYLISRPVAPEHFPMETPWYSQASQQQIP